MISNKDLTSEKISNQECFINMSWSPEDHIFFYAYSVLSNLNKETFTWCIGKDKITILLIFAKCVLSTGTAQLHCFVLKTTYCTVISHRLKSVAPSKLIWHCTFLIFYSTVFFPAQMNFEKTIIKEFTNLSKISIWKKK